MNKRFILLATLLSAVAASNAAVAQSTTATTDHPKAIGTSQQTADEANKKAVQNGDKASFVRTGPSAADRASEATAKTKEKVSATDGHDASTTAKHTGTTTKHKAKAPTDEDQGAATTSSRSGTGTGTGMGMGKTTSTSTGNTATTPATPDTPQTSVTTSTTRN